MICDRLNFNHVHYEIDIIKEKIVSKCACFINQNTELITAHQILHGKEKSYGIEDYEDYIKILEEHGIQDAREKLDNMFILDYLILNEDRHLNNFGIIRDVNTLKWIDVAPIFDNGQSLNILDYNEEEIIIGGKGRFFYNIENFDEYLKNIKTLKRIDVSKLDGVIEEFEELLHKYQYITKMTDKRIERLCILLQTRINKLKDYRNEVIM